MTFHRSNRRAKPRWLIATVAVGLLLVVSGGLSYAAVFGDDGDTPFVFELDRNPQDPILNADPDDWETLYDPANADPSDLVPTNGAIDALLTHDEADVDQTYYTGGSSKDDIDIDTVAGDPGSGGWLRDKTSSAQPKADIQHAFAATYIVDHDNNAATDGQTVVYFGLDRFSNDGATFAGFWFLQDDVTLNPTTANNGVGEINGRHQRGDLLVITDFTQGGPVVKLNVYVWIGPGGAKYPQYEQTVINGVFQLAYAGTDCTLSTTTGVACSTVNDSVVPSVWPFTPAKQVGGPDEYQPGLFLEGGINITDAFEGTDAPCFSSYVAETRASFSVDSTLSDFTLGGFNTCGSVTALKYHDRNADGSRDADGVDDIADNADDEVPLAGWTIFIDKDEDETLDAGETSVVTDSDGLADFGGALPAGDYTFCEVLDNATGEDHEGWFNSDPTGTTLCEDVTVGSGEPTTIDFGNYMQGTKSGFKYEDLNADSDKNGSDANLDGWTIYAIEDIDGNEEMSAADAATAVSQDTAGGGLYSFSLDPGEYWICEKAQGLTGTWTQSSPKTGDTRFTDECGDADAPAGLAGGGYDITVTSGSSETGNEFGNFKQGTKSGFKYEDLNADSDKNGSDANLDGWTIYAIEDIDGNEEMSAADAATAVSQDTAGGGLYSFSLDPGEYWICEKAQGLTGTWTQSSPKTGDTRFTDECGDADAPAGLAGGGYDITVTSGSSETGNEFGNYRMATKSGIKFNDRNGDGSRDANGVDNILANGDDEVLLPLWEIHLFGTAGDGSSVNLHTTTNGSGAYSFTVKPGSYTVCETLKSGWKQTLPSTGTACASHTTGAGGTTITPAAAGYVINLASGAVDNDNDFGNQELYKLIILTCSEVTGQLVQSTVNLTGFDPKYTIDVNPALISGDLCTLGGASYPNLTPGTYSPDVILPRYID